ncbi:hypothetical protein CPB86DRAFT_812430 [Serendipita vermifera]|nr:hypothetical protein CPB86DRAFT_812430 [Serendipita vermifera]
MGQYWELINIDKRERLPLFRGKWDEDYSSPTQYDIDILAPGERWAGDRIILIGDYADSFPPGIFTEEEAEEIDPTERLECIDIPGGWWTDPPFGAGNDTIALRNLNSHEYITDRLFPCSSVHPDLAQALSSKISWSSDDSMAMPWHPNWHRELGQELA